MYGDTTAMRRRVAQLREQGTDLRSLADVLASRCEQVPWRGRAADSMRARVRERAAHLRDCASRHDSAADSLQAHLHEVDGLKDSIAEAERRATRLVADARTRVSRLGSDLDTAGGGGDGARTEAAEHDRVLLDFRPPLPGHRDWLSVELPGL